MQTPPFWAIFVHPSLLHFFFVFVAPCFLHTPPVITQLIQPCLMHIFLYFVWATFFWVKSFSFEDCLFRFVDVSFVLVFTPMLSRLTTVLFRVEVRTEVKRMMMGSRRRCLCLPKLALSADQGTQIFLFSSAIVSCNHLLCLALVCWHELWCIRYGTKHQFMTYIIEEGTSSIEVLAFESALAG